MKTDVFENYENSRRAIGEYFGLDSIWSNVVIDLDSEWVDYGSEIGYGLQDGEPQYSFTIYGTSRWETEDHVLFVGDDCCGNRDMYVFAKSNLVEG